MDVLAVGPQEFSHRLERRDGLLVSVGSRSLGLYRRAFGLDDEPFDGTCWAGLELYGLTADEARNLFDERQERVIRHARSLAESRPI